MYTIHTHIYQTILVAYLKTSKTAPSDIPSLIRSYLLILPKYCTNWAPSIQTYKPMLFNVNVIETTTVIIHSLSVRPCF